MFLCSKLPCLGWRSANFFKVFFPLKYLQDLCNILVLDPRFLWYISTARMFDKNSQLPFDWVSDNFVYIHICVHTDILCTYIHFVYIHTFCVHTYILCTNIHICTYWREKKEPKMRKMSNNIILHVHQLCYWDFFSEKRNNQYVPI
jgi:hypothetical protein